MNKALRITAWVVGCLLVLLTIVYLGAGYMVYEKLTTVKLDETAPISNTPSNFAIMPGPWEGFNTSPYFIPAYEAVTFNSRQSELNLTGWYIEARPGAPVVVITHGVDAGKWTQDVLLPAGMLYKHGFNVLVYDLRNHGTSDSDGGHHAVGNHEYLDVLGAWDYLVKERGYDPSRVGLMGVSLGAGSTLIAFAEEPRAAAVLVDSPYADLQQIIAEEMTRKGYPTFLAPAGIFSARVIAGVDLLEHSPKDAVIKSAGRPMFIIHGTGDKRINIHHARDLQVLAQTTGANLDVWIVEGADHLQSFYLEPAAYEAQLAAFFQSALTGDIGQAPAK